MPYPFYSTCNRKKRLRPPTRVLRLEIEGPSKTFHLKARVIWSKRVPQQFMRTLRGGMGLELLDPGPEWIDFCDRAS